MSLFLYVFEIIGFHDGIYGLLCLMLIDLYLKCFYRINDFSYCKGGKENEYAPKDDKVEPGKTEEPVLPGF